LPGKPPREVKANPSVLKVVPLGDDAAIHVQKLVHPQVWQPFPVAMLDKLGGQVLPRLLGVEPPPAPAPAASAPASAPAATAAIPLKLDADVPRPPRRGAVYRVVQKNGTVLYTNVASLAKKGDAKMLFTYIVECYACDVHSRIDWNTVPLHLADYRDDIHAAAKLTGVNAALLRAVIHAESGFNPRALSYKGARAARATSRSC
jgi:soluble lytic murein transglycosylase-like protein